MFRGARRRRGAGIRGGIPMFLLGFQLLQAFTNSNQFLPVTFGTVAINILAFVQPHIGRFHFHWPLVTEVCVSTDAALFDGEWKRLVLASFFHLDEWHIYYNMASFVWKGLSLEKDMGSGYFCSLLAVFVLLTNLVYCGLQYAATLVFHDYSHLYQCAAGFSGVIFAVKVVTTYRLPPGMSLIMGILPVPSRLAVWVELIVISILVPRASFVGHLAGILVGMAYVMGPLKMIIDSFNGFSAGLAPGRSTPQYTYAARATGYREAHTQQTMDDSGNDPELQEAIRRSLNEHHTSSSSSMHPQHHSGPIGFEHLESEARNEHADGIGFEHLGSETRNEGDIGFEHLNREGTSIRHRSHDSGNTQMTAEQLRAARIARFERSNY